MPERAVCDEAMRLSQARLKVQDPDLKEGQVETFTVQTVAGPMSRPWGVEGGFAVVYKFRTKSGKPRALRCFRVPMNPDTQFRYERIGPYFATNIPNFTAEFKYHDNGIVLKENVQGQMRIKAYPLIEMEWIEGVTLLEHIDELCRKRDRTGLADLGRQWTDMLQAMHQAKIAHGDFAGNNVMVRSTGQIVLVDYDGVYIPAFTGLLPVVLGQVDYQHPQMARRLFNEQMDTFSALVIYTALLALQIQPGLWDKYTHRNPQGKLLDTNLLFTQQDFVDPDRSSLMATLERIGDTRVQQAVQALKQACLLAVTQPLNIEGIVDPDAEKKQALARLELAIRNNDDEVIVKAWVPKLLEQYAPAQAHVSRVERARRALETLKRFHEAIKSGKVQQIVAAYDPILEYNKKISGDERELLRMAQDFVQAHQADDDQTIATASEDIQNSTLHTRLAFTSQEQQRIALAQQRKPALIAFRQALWNKSIRQITAAYDSSLLDNCKSVSQDQRDLLRLALDFVQAYQADDDEKITVSSEAIKNSAARLRLTFSTLEQQRIALAWQRKPVLATFRTSIKNKSIQEIVSSYDWILDDCKSITQEERDLLKMAKSFVQACYQDNDEAISAFWEALQVPRYQNSLIFTAQEQQRITLARQRKAALATFRQAQASQSPQQIVTDYDAVLNGYKSVTQEERDLLQVAQDFVQAYQSDDDQMISTAYDDIQNSRHRQSFIFSAQEQQRIALAQQRKVALVQFRVAMMSKRPQQIVAAYSAVLDGCKNVLRDERDLLQVAKDFTQAYQSDDDEQIVTASETIHNSTFRSRLIFSEQEQQRIALAQERKPILATFRLALLNKNIEEIVSSYDWLLDDCKSITQEERDLLKRAKSFILVYYADDDDAISSAWEAIQTSHYQNSFVLTDQEQQRIKLAQQRKGALAKFRQTLASQKPAKIVADYDPILDNYRGVTPDERDLLLAAQDFIQAYQSDDDQLISTAHDNIQNSRHQQFLIFSAKEQKRIALAQQRKIALMKFRMAIMGKSPQQIVAAYDSVLDGCKNVTSDEREQLALLRSFVQVYQADDDQAIIVASEAIQNSPYQKFIAFSAQEEQRIALAQTKGMKQGGSPHA